MMKKWLQEDEFPSSSLVQQQQEPYVVAGALLSGDWLQGCSGDVLGLDDPVEDNLPMSNKGKQGGSAAFLNCLLGGRPSLRRMPNIGQ